MYRDKPLNIVTNFEMQHEKRDKYIIKDKIFTSG